ncbi:MAG: WbqC family protein [Bacteroidetes bacterium]|nr:WbqC family protein [Bacteroidota bacterium]MCH8524035.1 WbqC family protein [Balneolales bacterium]
MRMAWQLPTAFPDLYWLTRCVNSDLLLIDDTQPFNRKSRIHRGKIRNATGVQWIYIPIHPEDRKIPLREARVDTTTDWLTPLLRSLEFAYRNSIYYDFYEPEIYTDFSAASKIERYLEAINYLNSRLWEYLELSKPANLVYISELEADAEAFSRTMPDTSDEVQLFPEFNSSNYLKMPVTDQNRLEEYFSKDKKIHVIGSHSYNERTEQELISAHPVYRQHFGGFQEGCSLYDVLFEVGPEFWKIYDTLLFDR